MDGFYSSMEDAQYESFWSTKDKAISEMMLYVKDRNLKQQRNRKTKELIDVYSDGDYYCYVVELEVDVSYYQELI
jgi:hypothetical protein